MTAVSRWGTFVADTRGAGTATPAPETPNPPCQRDRNTLRSTSTSLRGRCTTSPLTHARCLTQPNLRSPRISLLQSSHSTQQHWSAKSDSEQAFVVWRSWKFHHTVTADNFSIISGAKAAQTGACHPLLSPHHSQSVLTKQCCSSIPLPHFPLCDAGFSPLKLG